MDYEFNILYYINIYKKWWKKIVLVMLVSMFLTMCFCLSQPVTYVSTVTLLLTGGESPESSLGRFLGLSGFSAGTSTDDIIISFLNSRRMSEDVREKFNLDKKPRFRYKLSGGTMAISAEGSDPDLTEKIANFIVQNLDKINMELDVTPNKPMVKVLDPAIRGTRIQNKRTRKIFVSGIMAFLLLSVYAFFSDYLKKLKSR